MRRSGHKSSRNFNPRSPHGERREEQTAFAFFHDFNPRSPHGERLEAEIPGINALLISTHAPRTGSDRGTAAVGGA